MIIDSFYKEIDKNNFYLGMISQVNRGSSVIQVENLSLFNHRKIKEEILIPSTINYLVLIDSVQGLFLGEIFQSKVSNSAGVHNSLNYADSESVYPEVSVNVVGLIRSGDYNFKLPGFLTVGITDKVYIANNNVIQKYLDSIEIKKNSETVLSSFATFSNLNNQKISLKPSTLFDRHLMAVGTTNSGKSTSALSILDKLIQDKKKVLIIDPTGEYNESFTNDEINKLHLGIDTVLSVGTLSIQQWAMLFETNDATQPAFLADAIKSLRFQKRNQKLGVYKKDKMNVSTVDSDMASVTFNDTDFDLHDLAAQISEETNQIDKNNNYISNTFQFNQKQWLTQKVQYKLDNTSLSTFFSADNDKWNLLNQIDNFLLEGEKSLYIDASNIATGDGVGGMIVDLISNYIINKKGILPFVLFIDEVHRYTKASSHEIDYYTGLTTIAREGRKKGVFLFLTTQNPQDVSQILFGQIGTLIIHRLTQIDELRLIQNHLGKNSIKQVSKLNQGEAILTSINLLQDIHVRVIKCSRIHNNETPKL